MAQTADFLVEIGTEELPPKALRALEADGTVAATFARYGVARNAGEARTVSGR